MVCCICVRLEVYMGSQHSCAHSCIHTISFSLTKSETLSVQVGVQWVYDIGWQAAVKKEPKDVVAVMPGSLKSYFYFV